MRAARSLAFTASRVSLRACVRTRRPVACDGVVRVVARRADGLRAAGLRLAAGLLVVVLFVLVVLVVFSAIRLSPCPEVRVLKILFALFVAGEHMYVNRSPGRVTAVA